MNPDFELKRIDAVDDPSVQDAFSERATGTGITESRQGSVRNALEEYFAEDDSPSTAEARTALASFYEQEQAGAEPVAVDPAVALKEAQLALAEHYANPS